MAGDKGFKKAEGMQGGEMENDRGKTDEGDHGWAPDSGKTSEPNKQAGNKAHHPEEAAPLDDKGSSASAKPAN